MLFVVQTLLEIVELQIYWSLRGSQFVKRISEAQRWILNNKILWAWGRLDSPRVTSLDVVLKTETLAYLSAQILMDYL